jgi:DNA-directed RNA polymerase subunit RPC12/RpoP
MKYLCNSCKKSFTTIASDQKTKDQFTLYLKDLRCFHCRSRDIELHDDCKGRICGEETVCDGCYSFFNCWTGNIDDGIIIEKDKQAEIESAKEKVKHIEKREAREQFENIHHRLDKKGFKYYIKYGARYIQILGTIWKLKDEDWNSIIAKDGTQVNLKQ